MSEAGEIVREALDEVFELAEDASYIPPKRGTPVACRVVLEPEVQTFADDRRTVSASDAPSIWILLAEVPEPRHGATIVIGDRRFILGRRTYGDAHHMRFDVAEER